MRLRSLFGSLIPLLVVACIKRSEASPVTGEPLPVAAKPATTEAPAPSAPRSALVGKPYRLLAILDPDRERMVAFALKIPSDWRAQQEFYRKWEGAVGLPQISI